MSEAPRPLPLASGASAEPPPAPPPETSATRAQLLWFDLTQGRWAALGALRERLGLARTLRVVAGVARREALGPDPLGALPRPQSKREELSHHQLRPVLVLDAALAAIGLGADERLEVLGHVIATSGSRFLASHFAEVSRPRWEALDASGREALVSGIMARFFNMQAAVVDSPGHDVAFDVSGCHFARLTRELGRPELGPLFCAADEAFFERPEAPLTLEREETIARGGERCAFRFTLR